MCLILSLSLSIYIYIYIFGLELYKMIKEQIRHLLLCLWWREGSADILNFLLDMEPELWNTVSHNGRTPLHTAGMFSDALIYRLHIIFYSLNRYVTSWLKSWLTLLSLNLSLIESEWKPFSATGFLNYVCIFFFFSICSPAGFWHHSTVSSSLPFFNCSLDFCPIM